MSFSWRFYPKRLTILLESYTVDAATGSNSRLSVLLKDTSTRPGIEPPTTDPQSPVTCKQRFRAPMMLMKKVISGDWWSMKSTSIVLAEFQLTLVPKDQFVVNIVHIETHYDDKQFIIDNWDYYTVLTLRISMNVDSRRGEWVLRSVLLRRQSTSKAAGEYI